MTAYYNEIDEAACAILREQIARGVIAPGVVDSRSIMDLTPNDLTGFTQVHLFAGGGLWSVAARMAGWPDDRPLWTASCPCQPFSPAGKGLGTDDPRHLWPDVYRLARARRPPVLVGEQAAGAAGYDWFDGVRADLEGEGYASRTVDIPALAVDAPHQRNRLYWVAVADADRGGRAGRQEGAQRGAGGRAAAERTDDLEHAACERRGEGRAEHELRSGRNAAAGADAQGVALGDAFGPRLEGQRGDGDRSRRPLTTRPVAPPDGRNGTGDLADADQPFGRVGDEQPAGQFALDEPDVGTALRPGSRNSSYWSDHEWIICHDGKARRTKPGLRLLVDGIPGRVDLWRVGGNAIVPQVAAEVLAALMEFLDMADCQLPFEVAA